MKMTRTLSAWMLVAVLLLALVGCGGGNTASTPASTPDSAPASTPDGSDPVSEPTSGGETTMTDEEFLASVGGQKPDSAQGVFLYKTVRGTQLYFHLQQPSAQKYEEAPLLVNFVGGGWTKFDIEGYNNAVSYMSIRYNTLLNEGFANLTVTYRGWENGGTNLSMLLADLTDALAYIARYNDTFHIDMNKIILLGQSAGGHVGLMLLLAPEELWTADCVYPAFEHNYLGCFAINAPTMMYPDEQTGELLWFSDPGIKHNLFGDADYRQDDSEYRKYSPITYVSADMKPVFLGVGEADTVVNPEQSYRFQAAAEAVGGNSTMLVMKNAGHGLEQVGDGRLDPSYEVFYKAAYDFIHSLL